MAFLESEELTMDELLLDVDGLAEGICSCMWWATSTAQQIS